ncbi:NAD(+) diphosphatase [uncultured Maritimibacter sp.]|uniref:NAD(+) diphosphatase n=2 Tax=Maritimibacter TaxID=404235 RepID=UPI0030DDB2B1
MTLPDGLRIPDGMRRGEDKMDLSELAFGGGGLDRAAHLRGEASALRASGSAQVLPIWRGRPLMAGVSGPGGDLHLELLAVDHPLITEHDPQWIYLGHQDGAPLFAADISAMPAYSHAADGGPGDPGMDMPAPPLGVLPEDARFPDLRSALAGLTPFESELAATARGILEWHRSHGFCAACGTRSEIDEAGWRRSCPACGRLHFPRTDPVVIMLVTSGNSVLLGRSPGWPEGMYSLLAGFMEPGETVSAAVAREVAEETGVRVGPSAILATQPWPFPASLMIGCHAEALSLEIDVDPTEIEHALWVTREDLVDVFAGTHPVIRRPRRGAIAQVLMKNWLAGTL